MRKLANLLLPDYWKRFFKYLYFRLSYNASVYSAEVALTNRLGEGVHISQGSIIGNSKIGEGTFINYNVQIFFSDIQRFCSIGQNSIIGANEHLLSHFFTSEYMQSDNTIKRIRKVNRRRTILEEDVWVGANVFIKKGVKIGRGSVIGAGSVVTHNIPSYTICAGVPAKVIGERFNRESIARINKSEWWKHTTGNLKELSNKFENPDIFLDNIGGTIEKD